MDAKETTEDVEHRRHVANHLIGYSAVGMGLGLAMVAGGVGGESFLDAPSALAIGAVTFAVGVGLRRSDGARS